MMFLEDPASAPGGTLAISQPAHAWVSGQLLRHWAVELDPPLLLAAEQHDLAWLDWELAPSFDARTGRPHLFRDVGAATHAPLWSKAVDRALASWGPHVALLISRHGTVIYTRFTDRHRLSEADGRAASAYLEQQTPMQVAWAEALKLDGRRLDFESGLIALVDTLSLALCGALPLPLEVEGPSPDGNLVKYRLEQTSAAERRFTLAPWPFRMPRFATQIEARPLPGGRFRTADEMASWVRRWATSPRAELGSTLEAG